MRIVFIIIISMLFGIALGGLFFGYYQSYAIDYILKLGVSLLWGAIGVTLVFILGFALLDRFAKRKLGVANYSATTIARRFNTLLWDALSLNRVSAQRTSEQLIGKVVAYVSMFMFYRWVVGVFLAIVGAVGGTLGTIVLINQNEKIAEQTEVAREQTAIAVQQFIRMKSDELDLIARKIDDLRGRLKPQDIRDLSRLYRRSGESPCWSKTGGESSTMPKSIDALDPRIRTDVELLASLVLLALEGASGNRPHHKSFRSNLLRLLASSNLPFSIFGQGAFNELTLDAGNFKGANLDDVTLGKVTLSSPALFQGLCAANLRTINLSANSIDFSGSTFIDVSFDSAELRYAKFSNATIKATGYNPGGYYPYGWSDVYTFEPKEKGIPWLFDYALGKLKEAFTAKPKHPSEGYGVEYALELSDGFAGANMEGAEFLEAVMEHVVFDGASLIGAKFKAARVSGRMSFRRAKLTNADFRLHPASAKELTNVDFTEAVLDNSAVDGLDFGDNKTLTEKQVQSACTCSGAFPILMGKKVAVGACQPFVLDEWGTKKDVCAGVGRRGKSEMR